MNDNYRQAFREEANELLSELETALLALEQNPSDPELIGRVFRAMHTIKGSGAMFGFDAVAAFTHDVETAYDLIRNGKMAVTQAIIGLTLNACDEIKRLICEETGELTPETLALSQAFRQLIETCPKEIPKVQAGLFDAAAAVVPSPAGTAPEITYRIRFKPEHGLFATGTNPILLLNELRELGKCSVFANTEDIPFIEEMEPEGCYTSWDVVLTTDRDINAIRDVFIFVEDQCELAIEVIDDGSAPEGSAEYKKLGEILVERGVLEPLELQQMLNRQQRIGTLLMDSGKVSAEHVQAALMEQEHIRDIRQKRQAAEVCGSIRVPAEKLDEMVNMVGELVTVQSRLNQLSNRMGDLILIQVAEEFERLTSGLRESTMSIRMLPIGATFNRFQRLVRDLSLELGKEIVLMTEGEETELDKTVIEKLNDPLVHLIRNSIDHGIEKPDVRRAKGKPEAGTVLLSAEHSGANVLIRISDDGAGLDAETIRAKAIEKGLLAADASLSESEIYQLIFQPGFSTAKVVTSVSGRGVGMDVVKKGIESLQGTIDITSERDRGTTITLKLPLTMAIIDGLLVRIDDTHYIMPLAAIEECVELTRKDVEEAHGKHIASIRGEIVPYIHLRQLFGHGGDSPEIEQIVTARIDGGRIGFVVDQVIGQHQTVIKSISRMYNHIEYVSGATILGDGSVALILDLPKLVRHAEGCE
ncbi:chemotaxis protein CheA [Desulfatirhabdium butyrativorans]|uniref:chemotaxis protein CheA n=1 Tax=Desulfatirhabdium butyrativorans TaxID=340467 RepID=UPI0003F69760|nr:chemotaxis protein CheA [Desulfatirhabdium butyrativorans]